MTTSPCLTMGNLRLNFYNISTIECFRGVHCKELIFKNQDFGAVKIWARAKGELRGTGSQSFIPFLFIHLFFNAAIFPAAEISNDWF